MPSRPMLLIIDDVPDNVEVLGEILSDIGDISFALSGVQGLEMINQTLPDLILLDVMMPGMDGYQVIDVLKRQPGTCDLPVIFVTARNDAQSETAALAAGAIDFIHKPVNKDVVRARVRLHLTLLERQRELQRNNTELERLNRELELLSATDALTGVHNRLKSGRLIKAALERSRRLDTALSVVMLDIDHFKQVNDLHGHAAGDQVLIRMARIMRDNCRETDSVGRWGGEEFLLLLPDTDSDAALRVAEKLRAAIALAPFPLVGCLTVSLGVSCFDGQEDEDQLLARADAALYDAKNGGRNRVVLRLRTAT